MKPLSEWRREIQTLPAAGDVELVETRSGQLTLRRNKAYLHSRYNPWEEAERLIDAAGLDVSRPILVVGLGLGYHVAALLNRGAGRIAVVEPDPGVARTALECGVLSEHELLLGVGNAEHICADPAFSDFAGGLPQLFVHPPTARLNTEFAETIAVRLTGKAFEGLRLHVAVVGPMYGGSLPIARYLSDAFEKLGHETLFVDNSPAWELFNHMKSCVESKPAAGQLADMFTHMLSEWNYVRVAEFQPDICIVVAQAPVEPSFPVRLAEKGIVTAFWYVENWRHLRYWKDIALYYDYFFHIQPGEFEQKLAECGCPAHAYVQTGCDPDVHKPVSLSEDEKDVYKCDLSFAGAGYLNRVEMFKGLTDYNFKIWGVDWPGGELEPFLCMPGQRFDADVFAKIVAGSRINLNLHSSAVSTGVDPNCDAVNPRVFEIAACGGFQLCDPCKGLAELLDFDTELPTYSSLRELREKIDHFLADPAERAAFAERARNRVLRDHTYENRAGQMIDLILGRYGARILGKGVREQRTVREMANVAGTETPLGSYLAKLPPETLFTFPGILHHVPRPGPDSPEPEKIFAYLRELRDFADLAGPAEE